MDKVVFILGATGTGKSDMAVRLAQKFGGEIISADSVQIYKGFDIGSAKIMPQEMGGIVHHCIDIANPDEYFTVYDFVKITREKIAQINARNHLAIVVGGTGLYIKALIEGYNFGEANKNQEFRDNLEKILQEKGKEHIWQMLQQKDVAAASKIDKNNAKRVIRALEICEYGEKMTKTQCDFDYLLLALTLDRQILYDKINRRVDIMINNGLIDEVKGLIKQNIPLNAQPMQAIGYKEIVDYLQGKIDKDTAIDLVKQHSRNYAKRQMTFLRGIKGVNYIDAADKNAAYKQMETLMQDFVTKIKD